jgi:hypothetical protein
MTLTLSLGINATLTDGQRYNTATLPLVWITMPLTGWQRFVRQIKNAVTIAGIGWRSLAWGVL